MRRVLMILYYFPPSGGPGVQRGLKFVRYLPEFGWEPIVLTVGENADFMVRDETLCREIPPGLRVVRTRCPEFYGLYRTVTQQSGASLDVTSQSHGEQRPVRRMLRWLRGAIFVPDGRMAWTPFAVSAGVRLLRESRCQVIFSSGPPFTCHAIGRALHRRSRLPWVADYRDPWTTATFYPARPAFARKLDLRLEAACIRAAACNIAVGDGMVAELRRRYPDLPPERFRVIPNGYDPADFAHIPYQAPDTFRITHAGSLFRGRAPELFLQAIEELMGDEPGFAASVRLCFAGRIDGEVERRLTGSPLGPICELPGYLPHRQSIELLRRSRLLLLAVGTDAQSQSMVTGKLFEYLAAEVPILALAPQAGDAARLLARSGAGWVFAPDDGVGIREHLRGLWRAYRAAQAVGTDCAHPLQFGLTRNEEEIASYSRRELTRRLADSLAACAG